MTTATQTTRCSHDRTRQVGPDRCYVGSVAVYPYTDENPSATGNITYTEECERCGARRSVNANGWHVELGPFGPTADEREAEEARESAHAKAKQDAADTAILAKYGTKVLRVSFREILMDVRGVEKWVSLEDAELNAAHPDADAEVVAIYSALVRKIRAH